MDKMVRVDPRAVFERDDYGSSSTLGLRPGERITVENLLYALLLGSANDAADALAIAVDGSVPRVRAPDERARASARHVADAVLLARTAWTIAAIRPRATCCASSGLTDASDAFTTDHGHTVPSDPGTARARPRHPEPERVALAVRRRLRHEDRYHRRGRRLPRGVRGAGRTASRRHRPRRPARALLLGRHPARVRLRRVGATRTSSPPGIRSARPRSGEARCRSSPGPDLDALVPVREDAEVQNRSVIDPRAAFPPAPGERIGLLVVHAGPEVLGRVPLIVPAVPPAPATSGPWWLRAAGAVGGAVVDGVRALAA